MNGLTIALIVILVIIIILIIVLVPIFVLGSFVTKQIDDASRLYDGDMNKATCFVEAVYKDDGITDSAKKAFPETLKNLSNNKIDQDTLQKAKGIKLSDAIAIMGHFAECDK
jgi:hypothetical protein